MSSPSEIIECCSSCGAAMDVTAVAPFSNVVCPACGEDALVKREFGPYTITRLHAIGGMSMVFVALDNTLNREVVLKILSEAYSADERRIIAFEEEARITASFSHPHVVRVLRTGRAFGRFYIAMELVPGGHFEHQIRERGTIAEAEMLPLAIDVAQGLKAAHSAGLIHRDVKPGNILLDAEGRAKIVDFGLALVTQGGKVQASELWATPYYVPPETIEGVSEDFRSDIYAFGATVYHALAGQPSCGEETMVTAVLREAKRNVVPLRRVAPWVSAETSAIVERAMAYDPKDRFSSYDELIMQLESAKKHLKSGAATVAEVSQSVARRRAARKRRELSLYGGLALVFAGAIGTGVWWVNRKPLVAPASKPSVRELVPFVSKEPASTEIAQNYRDARVAVAARDFETAMRQFTLLGANPSVQEPTRMWAGVEAVAAAYLAGRSVDARRLARLSFEHIASIPDGSVTIGRSLTKTLKDVRGLPVIPADSVGAAGSDAFVVMGWMLAGLKNWEQGALVPASRFFSAVVSAKLPQDAAWGKVYQELANDYLADYILLTSAVFEQFPADQVGCEAAVASLDGVLGSLKTVGRARFNVRAWQLDLKRHGKVLESAGNQVATPALSTEPQPELVDVMARLNALARDCRFLDAAGFLKSLGGDPVGAKRDSLLAVVEFSSVFLSDLEQDLVKGAVTTELLMKSGEIVQEISVNPSGLVITKDAAGNVLAQPWSHFTADALITLHRIFVKSSQSDLERLRRHQCAIAFDWLVGNRERSLTAATSLMQSSPSFKRQWETIVAGLPK